MNGLSVVIVGGGAGFRLLISQMSVESGAAAIAVSDVDAHAAEHAHASERELGKIHIPDLAIHAGPNAFASALSAQPVKGEWRAKARADYDASFEAPDQPRSVDMVKVMAYLRQRLPDDVILTNGAGNFTVWPNKFFKFDSEQQLLVPQSGAMGYGLPAVIAAKVTQPDRTVVCFAGDGDFQMNCHELGSAMQARAQPIVLILNNGTYCTIRMHQERVDPARVSGTTLENPDFCMLAKSCGYHAEKIATTTAFRAAFECAMNAKTGAVLEFDVAAEAITPGQALSQMREAALAARKAN